METATVRGETAEAAAPNELDEMSLFDLLIIIAQGKKTVVTATLIAAALALAVSLLMPNRYTAITKIMPPQPSPSLTSTLMGQLGPLGALAGASQAFGLKDPNEIYLGMMKSRTLEDALIQRFDLRRAYRTQSMADARTMLASASEISLGDKDSMITVAIEDRDPKRAAALANAYVDELRNLTQNLAVTEAGQRRVFFEQQLERAKSNLASAEEDLKRTQQSTGILDLNDQAKSIIESVVVFRAQVAAKEVELRAMRSFATDRNPDLVVLEQQLAGMRAQLASLEKQSGGDGDIQVATRKVPEKGLEYVRRLRNVKYYETILELLAKQCAAARLDEEKNAAIIQVLDVAVEPERKSSPRRSLIVMSVTLLAFFSSALYVIARELLQRMRSDPWTSARLELLKSAAAFVGPA